LPNPIESHGQPDNRHSRQTAKYVDHHAAGGLQSNWIPYWASNGENGEPRKPVVAGKQRAAAQPSSASDQDYWRQEENQQNHHPKANRHRTSNQVIDHSNQSRPSTAT